MSDLTFSKIDLISLLNLLSVTQVLISVPDPTLAVFFTFSAPYDVAHFGFASCSKKFLLSLSLLLLYSLLAPIFLSLTFLLIPLPHG